MAVPVIDLENLPAELEKLAAAVTGLGYFRVVKHGMPPGLAQEMKSVARSLFQMPAEVKLRNVNDSLYNANYVPPKKMSQWFESFSIYDTASTVDVLSFCSVLQVSERQREVICEYVANIQGAAMNIACKVAESEGVIGYSFHEWTSMVRLNSYNFTIAEDIGSVGLQAHTDSNFITVLQEDDSVGGLEVMTPDGKFMSIDPVPGTFFVFVGDVGKVWSNGRMPNVKHKVVCKVARPRITIALSLLAPKDDKIEPENSLIDSDHPKLYQAFMYHEYRKLRNLFHLSTDEKILPLLKASHHEESMNMTTLMDKLQQSISKSTIH